MRAAPRRYRLPPLPAGIEAARAAGADTALAFAIEAARLGQDGAGLRELFTASLARAIEAALSPTDGDAAFQALVLRAQHPHVEEHVRLSKQLHADRRALRTLVDAFAHPGKLGALDAPLRDPLASLHALARAGAWTELQGEARALRDNPAAAPVREALDALLAHPALARLERNAVLLAHDAVQRYLLLCGQRGPLAGSAQAAAHGRAAARVGANAEHATLEALRRIALLLDALPGAGRHRAVRGLPTPAGFPGAIDKAKDEWDAALLVEHADGARVLLVAEVKASPAAATPDYLRLQRGLQRLALAEPGRSYPFASGDGEVRLAGASLRALQPAGRALPPHVIYCSTSPPEVQPQLLSAASRAVLLAERESIAYARAVAEGQCPGAEALAPVWAALRREPRLRSALHQDETSRAAREAMLHPDDLLAAVVETLGRR